MIYDRDNHELSKAHIFGADRGKKNKIRIENIVTANGKVINLRA